MKILNRKQFLAMPHNTLYSDIDKTWHPGFNDLKIKGGSWENDFQYDDLIVPVCICDLDKVEEWMKLAEIEDVSLDFNFTGRDGMFEEEQTFAVYSKNDVKQLIDRLKKCIK